MSHFRYLTAGESHGKCLTAIIEGLPSGLYIDVNFINNELSKRQQGYGRSERMQIETDKVEITSGIYDGKTTGAPVCLVINNKDYSEKPSFTKFRPGHADFAGSTKYNLDDLRPVLERASARKTAIDVTVGAVAKLLLKEFGIISDTKILQIGKAIENFDHFLFNFMPAVFCFKYLVQSLVAVPFVRQPIHNTISEMFCQQFLITFLKFFKSFFLPLFSLLYI